MSIFLIFKKLAVAEISTIKVMFNNFKLKKLAAVHVLVVGVTNIIGSKKI